MHLDEFVLLDPTDNGAGRLVAQFKSARRVHWEMDLVMPSEDQSTGAEAASQLITGAR